MKENKILIVGLGDLGSWVLEFLARTPMVPTIVTADVNEDWGKRKTNCAKLNAAELGLYPTIEFERIDLTDIDKTAEQLREIDPSLIYAATTLQSWWVVTELPKEQAERIAEAQLGPWLPMHLTLLHYLMQAVKKSGISAHVVNSSFPDATHPVLGKVGLAPTVGIGNFDLIVPRIRLQAATRLKVSPNNISVFMIGHHYHAANLYEFGTMGDGPYLLKVLLGDKDVTQQLNIREMLKEPYPTTQGRFFHPVVASSAVKNILAISNDTGELTHAPGPNGLPGGYPVRLSAKGCEVVLPDGLALEDAIRINEEAAKCDGIERIDADGTVTITDRSYRIMKDLLGYDCKKLKIEESPARAKELSNLYRKFIEKFKSK